MITRINDTRLTSEQIGATQSKILRGVYTPEYPSSVCNSKNAIEQTHHGIQNVLFWGENLTEIQAGNGGTIALVDSDIPQCLEICRAGATIETGESVRAIQTLIDFFLKSKEQYPTLYVTTRNCMPRTALSGTEIKGGQTIYTIFNRLKDFHFFGFAPWYIMPGGAIEALDIRVLQRDIDIWKDSFQKGNPLFVASNNVGSILKEMLSDYTTDEKRIQVVETTGNIEYDNIGGVFSTDYSELGMRNSLFFTPGHGENTMEELSNNPTPIKTIRFDLCDRTTLGMQRKAELLGYRFTGIIPTLGKCFGFWTRIDGNFPIAKPCYLHENNKRLPSYQKQLYESLYSK